MTEPEQKQDERSVLAAEIHAAWEHYYEDCDHGIYVGGRSHGQTYAMCDLMAGRIIERRRGKKKGKSK